jgi:hypothetical protein
MRWSKLKQIVEQRMAPSLNGRVELHRTNYHAIRGPWGRAWITIDKEQVWSTADDPWYEAQNSLTREIESIYQSVDCHDSDFAAEHYRAWDQSKAILRQQAVMYTGEFGDLLRNYLSLSIDDAMNAESPLIRAIAMTDYRLGKRRLRALASKNAKEHSLVKLLYRTRCEAEGVNPNPQR